MMGFGHGWGMGGYGMHGFLGGIFMILFWVLIIIGIVYLVRNLNHSNQNQSNRVDDNQNDSALKIARERYARGEISKEEFNQLLDDLK